MNRFIELFLADYKWARKLRGGKWVCGIENMKDGLCPWVTWNDPEDLEIGLWPLNPKFFICEEYE